VAEVYRVGETEVYTVRDGPVGEFDVPAVRDIIKVFDPRAGRIVVDEAVLDLDAAPVEQAARPPRRRRWSRHGKGPTGPDPKPREATPPDAAPLDGRPPGASGTEAGG